MNRAIRRALFSKLSGDATLTAMLSNVAAIYHSVAPANADYPLVIFHQQTGRKERTFGADAWRDTIWLVKGVCRDGTSDPVDNIADRIDALLDDGSLTIEGGTLVDLSHESDVGYREPETDGDQQYRHAGALYRLRVARNS